LSRLELKFAAGTAIYLASRAGDYVVGATLAVDGGVAYARTGFEGARRKA
jgi:NAD(P)-dependent dehydrogenase (short-subunit alcohol dehydrogenase family)